MIIIYLETSGGQRSSQDLMLFIFSVLLKHRHLCKLDILSFKYRYIICAVPLENISGKYFQFLSAEK